MPRYYKNKIYDAVQIGHLKGVMEKLAIEALRKLEKKQGDKLHWNLAQLHQQQFKIMHKNALKNGKF